MEAPRYCRQGGRTAASDAITDASTRIGRARGDLHRIALMTRRDFEVFEPATAKRLARTAYRSICIAGCCWSLAGCASTSQAPAAGNSSFATFWREFRLAALAEDGPRVEAFTLFPFAVKGPLDSGGQRSYDRAGFRRLLPRLLTQDSGLTEAGESMKRLLARTANVPPHEGDTARFGTFLFRRSNDGWRLVGAYLDD